MDDLNENHHPRRILREAGYIDCFAELRLPTPITHSQKPSESQRTATLLTNAIFVLIISIALGILLYLSHFSGFLRLIIWLMYAVLCLHITLTYFRHCQ